MFFFLFCDFIIFVSVVVATCDQVHDAETLHDLN